MRKEPLTDAFQGNYEEFEAKVEAWKKANPGAPDPWLSQDMFGKA